MSPEAIKAEQERRQAEAEILAEKARQRKAHIEACVSVGICPDCGSELEAVKSPWNATSTIVCECPDVSCFKLWTPNACRSIGSKYYDSGSEVSRGDLAAEHRNKEDSDRRQRVGIGIFSLLVVSTFGAIILGFLGYLG